MACLYTTRKTSLWTSRDPLPGIRAQWGVSLFAASYCRPLLPSSLFSRPKGPCTRGRNADSPLRSLKGRGPRRRMFLPSDTREREPTWRTWGCVEDEAHVRINEIVNQVADRSTPAIEGMWSWKYFGIFRPRWPERNHDWCSAVRSFFVLCDQFFGRYIVTDYRNFFVLDLIGKVWGIGDILCAMKKKKTIVRVERFLRI